ncbi:MAG: hypothetical protein IMZ61_07700 [Planctomycetes bacterium]|nr:hypothetical protein [Planctomycetota bacterium]
MKNPAYRLFKGIIPLTTAILTMHHAGEVNDETELRRRIAPLQAQLTTLRSIFTLTQYFNPI